MNLFLLRSFILLLIKEELNAWVRFDSMYFSFIGLFICASCAILEVSLIRLKASKALKLLLEVRVCTREKHGSDVLAVGTLKSLIRMSRMLVIVV